MERSGAPTELEKPGEVRGVKPEDLMRFQPANTHRGLRPNEPHEEAGHMTASNPPASTQSFPLRVGGHPHMRLLVDGQDQRVLGRIDVETPRLPPEPKPPLPQAPPRARGGRR